MTTDNGQGGRDPLQQMIIDELRGMRQESNQRLDSMRSEFNQRLDRLVTTEAFAGEQRRVDDRIADLQAALTAEKEARVSDKKEAEGKTARVAANLRWTAASIVIPIGLFATTIILNAQGGT